MKAIETRYKGYRFRSRLEARWAVFFDALCVRWEYEPEGFELGDGIRYLPDFKLTSCDGVVCWCEIKPHGVTSDKKFDAFKAELWSAYRSDCDEFAYTAFLNGDPLEHFFESGDGHCYVCPRCALPIANKPDYRYSDPDVSIVCTPCDFNTPGGGDNEVEHGALADCVPHKGWLIVSHWDRFVGRIRSAATAARGARFEHGERRCA
jgi:hypothetical protein